MRVGASNLAHWFAHSRQALLLLWALYLVPRALLILLDVQPWSDAQYYFSRAALLAEGHGYVSHTGQVTAFWPPGWPFTLSVAFRAFGASVAVVGLFNLASAAASAALVLALGRRVGGSGLAARLALLLLALYPNNAAYVPLALTEVFYTTLLLAICWLLVEQRTWLWFAAAGLLLGLATLIKAQTLLVVPLILGIALLRSARFWAAVPRLAVQGVLLGLLAALVVLPWSFRNQRELGQFVAVSTNGGVTLATGNNPHANGGYVDSDPAYRALFLRRHTMDEPTFDAAAKKLGADWIKANPGRFLALIPAKLIRLWGPDGEAIWNYEKGAAAYARHAAVFQAVRWLNQVWYWLLLAGFALALVAQVRRRWRWHGPRFDWWLLPYGIALYPTIVSVIFSGQSRFHYPAMPFICMAVAWLLVDRVNASRWAKDA